MAPGSVEWTRLIIAMKGHPFTRKTEFAKTIAAFLECPILSTEDIISCLTPPLSPKQEYEAFMAVCQIARRHLCTGIFKKVVIDSPLSSESHLNHLASMASELFFMRVHIIIIECKPTHHYSWKMKFQDHLARSTPKPEYWYKPKNWEDIEKAIQDNPDYDFENQRVSKLVVDPLMDFPFQSRTVYYGEPAVNMNPDLVEVVKYMMSRAQGDGTDVIVYREWVQQSQRHSSSSSSSTTPLGENHCRNHGHDIVPNSKVVKHEAADSDCMACQGQILIGVDAYCYCKNCGLALHMKCAQAKRNYSTRLSSSDDEDYEPTCIANPCKESHKEASHNCQICVFHDHLTRRSYPTVIKHFDTEEHFFTILFKLSYFPFNGSYQCVVCGQKDGGLMYLCKDCGIVYCYECLCLPRRLEDEHGGHHHTLSLKFTSEEAEDYLCLDCLEFRDPTLWFYSCEDCPGYDLHPHCIYKIRKEFSSFSERWYAQGCQYRDPTLDWRGGRIGSVESNREIVRSYVF